MEPIIKELNTKKTLIKEISVNGKNISEITIKRLIIRPVMKRIVFVIDELDRVILYDGDTDFEAHKSDSDDVLIAALLDKINKDYKAV